MNHFLTQSIDIAMNKDYLDRLYAVYPVIPSSARCLDDAAVCNIEKYYNQKNSNLLIKELLRLELFPFKDSFVSFFRRYPKSIDLNTRTVNRIASILYGMDFDTIIEKSTVPKETNRQMGPMFKNWISKNSIICIKVYNELDEFLKSNDTAILNSSDNSMMLFAKDYLGYHRNKGIDFIARIKNINNDNIKYIVGEAKFLTDYGGHQNLQLEDAMLTLTSSYNKNVIPISILDGVCYIQGNNKMYKKLLEYQDNYIMSALLLGQFINYIEVL
ncbi:MAG: hypothetical protein K2N11_05575 [Mucispirillum sp.]|nr:hypothetical protein [Mucispirillum sp.]